MGMSAHAPVAGLIYTRRRQAAAHVTRQASGELNITPAQSKADSREECRAKEPFLARRDDGAVLCDGNCGRGVSVPASVLEDLPAKAGSHTVPEGWLPPLGGRSPELL